MSLATLTGLPRQLAAGDTTLWTENFTDYPVGTWTAKFVLNMGSAQPITLDATTSGSDFLFTLPRLTSAGIPPGDYEFAIYVTDGTQRTTAKTGTVSVLPDLAQGIAPTFAEKQVTNLEGAIATLNASTSQSVSFNGQSFTRQNLADYQKQLTYWQARVIAEQAKLAAQRGAGDPGRIQTQFYPQDGCPFPDWPYRC